MELKEVLEVGDELNLYLVANDLKPASMIYLSSLNPTLDNRVTKEEELQNNVRIINLRVNSDVVDDLKSYLDISGEAYKDLKQEIVTEAWESGIKTMHQTCYDHAFDMGSSQQNLERLLSAKTDREIGFALGYPIEAIEAFQQVIDGERRDGTYVLVSLARAKQGGLELPTWLGYISFVPEDLDLVNGNVSPSSKELGEKNQNFVRKNNPELANRVEQHFLDTKLPDSWEKTPSGSYNYIIKLQPSPEK